jgi:hypothetical protein
VDADAALARKLMQEEEDLMLAQRLMQEEEQAAQVWRLSGWCKQKGFMPDLCSNCHSLAQRAPKDKCARFWTALKLALCLSRCACSIRCHVRLLWPLPYMQPHTPLLPKSTHMHCPPFPGAPLQVRQQAADRYKAEMQAEAAVAQAASSWRSSQRTSLQAPPNLMPPGYDPADTAPLQAQRMPPAAGAAGAGPAPQPPAQRAFNVGQAMAQMLLSMPMPMPMPRWSGRGSGGGRGGARRGLPANLMQMRDAVLGMQRAGLPPHLLFSDRDFTAGMCYVWVA